MTTPLASGSMERLVTELSSGVGAPIVVVGDVGSGRTAVIDAAAAQLGLAVYSYEACRLTAAGATALPWERGAGGGGLRTELDELIALVAMRGGDPLVIVVDHLDSALVSDQSAIVEALEWAAGQVRVVVIAQAQPAFSSPHHWRVVEHDTADVVRWWNGSPPAPSGSRGDFGL